MGAGLAARLCFCRTTFGEALLGRGHALDFRGNSLRHVVKTPRGLLEQLDALAEIRLLVHRCVLLSWLLTLDQPAAAAGSICLSAPDTRGVKAGDPMGTFYFSSHPRHRVP